MYMLKTMWCMTVVHCSVIKTSTSHQMGALRRVSMPIRARLLLGSDSSPMALRCYYYSPCIDSVRIWKEPDTSDSKQIYTFKINNCDE